MEGVFKEHHQPFKGNPHRLVQWPLVVEGLQGWNFGFGRIRDQIPFRRVWSVNPTSWKLFRWVTASKQFFSSFSQWFSLLDFSTNSGKVSRLKGLVIIKAMGGILFSPPPSLEELVASSFFFSLSNNVNIISLRESISSCYATVFSLAHFVPRPTLLVGKPHPRES